MGFGRAFEDCVALDSTFQLSYKSIARKRSEAFDTGL